jgi:hypothetical protein
MHCIVPKRTASRDDIPQDNFLITRSGDVMTGLADEVSLDDGLAKGSSQRQSEIIGERVV